MHNTRTRLGRRGEGFGATAVVWTAFLGVLVATFWSLPRASCAAEAKPRPAADAPPTGLPPESIAAAPIEKSPAKDKSSPGRRLLREGAELREQLGTFRAVGGRLVFALDKQPVRLVALENLNLERIARVLSENPAAAEWRISGVVSEYRGVNYVLIERAVLRNTTAEPPPATPTTMPSTTPTADVKPKETASH